MRYTTADMEELEELELVDPDAISRTKDKVGVILGAGASWDAWSPGGPPPTQPEWRPPLAKDLFLFGEHPIYWNVVAAGYRCVRVLASELAEVVAAGTATLEAKLVEYANHRTVGHRGRLAGGARRGPPERRHA